MADKRCFVQFPHPGGGHQPDRDDKVGWNYSRSAHNGGSDIASELDAATAGAGGRSAGNCDHPSEVAQLGVTDARSRAHEPEKSRPSADIGCWPSAGSL